MIVFYTLGHLIGFSCSISLIATVIVVILKRKKERMLIIALVTTQVSFILAAIIFWQIGYDLQVKVALPVIEKSLNEQCKIDFFNVSEEGFYIDSGYHWVSENDNISCYYNHAEWICDC